MKVIFFDGICFVCNGFVNFINKNDTSKTIYFCDLNSEKAEAFLEKYMINIESLNTIVYLKSNNIYYESDAIIEIINSLNGIYRLINLFKIIPKNIRNYLYRNFAKKRLLFGQKEKCSINNKIKNQLI